MLVQQEHRDPGGIHQLLDLMLPSSQCCPRVPVGRCLADPMGLVAQQHVEPVLLSIGELVEARQRELAVLEAELEELISRSHHLDPADCTDHQICHILGRAT